MHGAIRRAILKEMKGNQHAHLLSARNRLKSSCEAHSKMYLPTLNVESRKGENVCHLSVGTFFFLYLNSRQWHWSEGRHPVGQYGHGMKQSGGFLLWWDAETNDAGKFWVHKFSTPQSQLITLVADALLRCSPNASDESAFYDQVSGATGRMCSHQGGIPRSLTGCTQ